MERLLASTLHIVFSIKTFQNSLALEGEGGGGGKDLGDS
jgi:hypothetical protein